MVEIIGSTPIVAGLKQVRWEENTVRPAGTFDWLFILTLRGPGWFRTGEARFIAGAQDLTLIRQGTPHDYGCEGDSPCWDHIWIHVKPRPTWIEWLHWPELSPGVMNLRLPQGPFQQIESDFRELEALLHSQVMFRKELAMNILERAILRCESVNPRYGEVMMVDPRISKSIEWVSQHFREPYSVAELAKLCGLSRSRFSDLFHAQVGLTPGEFVEKQRLALAMHLLRYTTMSVSEIADRVGYSSVFYFSRRFKHTAGRGPLDYRNQR